MLHGLADHLGAAAAHGAARAARRLVRHARGRPHRPRQPLAPPIRGAKLCQFFYFLYNTKTITEKL